MLMHHVAYERQEVMSSTRLLSSACALTEDELLPCAASCLHAIQSTVSGLNQVQSEKMQLRGYAVGDNNQLLTYLAGELAGNRSVCVKVPSSIQLDTEHAYPCQLPL